MLSAAVGHRHEAVVLLGVIVTVPVIVGVVVSTVTEPASKLSPMLLFAAVPACIAPGAPVVIAVSVTTKEPPTRA